MQRRAERVAIQLEVIMETFNIPWTDGEMQLNIPARNIETVVRPKESPALGEPLDLVKRGP